jgi:hypothetical protein
MSHCISYRAIVILHVLSLVCVSWACAITAEEVINENEKRNALESFRVGLQITNKKGSEVVSSHFIWVAGATDQGATSLFVEFDEPEEAKGMRFLLRFPSKGSPDPSKVFAYMPATGITVPMKPGDSRDVGGTGMTVDDFRGFVPAPEGKLRLLEDERIGDRECYLISASLEGKQTDKIWITKDQFLVVKTQRLDAQGTLEREFKALEFFRTQSDKMWPRKEEILVPKDGVRIVVEQQTGVYNIEVQKELLSPETFGTFKWRTAPQ